MICKNCGSPVDDWMKVCPNCQANMEETGEEKTEIKFDETDLPKKTYPMKWYKFLIYFMLFANAVLNILYSISYFFGFSYDEYVDIIYEVYPMMEITNIVYGVLSLGLAALSIFTRQALAHMKTAGPRLLYSIYITVIAANIIYYILGNIIITETTITHGDLILTLSKGDITALVSSVIGGAVMIILNYIYFRKRAELFKN